MTLTYLAEKYGTWFLGACLSVGMYVHKLYLDRLKEQSNVAKAERDKARMEVMQICERLEKVEDVDKEALPKFKDLLSEVKELRETVKNHHETRFTGIVNDIGNMRDKVEYRFTNNEKAIADINRNFDKLQDKIDKNAEKAEQNFKDMDRSMKELLSAFAKNNRA